MSALLCLRSYVCALLSALFCRALFWRVTLNINDHDEADAAADDDNDYEYDCDDDFYDDGEYNSTCKSNKKKLTLREITILWLIN